MKVMHTREQALVQLVRLEPIELATARIVCGWPKGEFERVLRYCLIRGKVYQVRRAAFTHDHQTKLVAP